MLFSILYYSILFSGSFFSSYFQAVITGRAEGILLLLSSKPVEHEKGVGWGGVGAVCSVAEIISQYFAKSSKHLEVVRFSPPAHLATAWCCTKASLKQHIYSILPCIPWGALPLSWGLTLNLVLLVICHKHWKTEWGGQLDSCLNNLLNFICRQTVSTLLHTCKFSC